MPQNKFDSAYAELRAQLKREQKSVAELKRIEAELRKLEREYRKCERERKLYKRRYVSVTDSRVWRYTSPARKLGTLLKYVFKPKPTSHFTNTDPGGQELQARGEPLSKSEISKGYLVEYVESTARNKTSGRVTGKSRELERYEAQIERLKKKLARSKTSGQVTDKSRDRKSNETQVRSKQSGQVTHKNKDLKEYIIRIENVEKRLYTLGFTERAFEELQTLAANDSNPAVQRLAAWRLALFYAEQYSGEGARQCLALLPVALQGKDVSGKLRRQAAILEAECQEALGNKEAAKSAITHALESGPHADLFLANANLEASTSAKVEWINKALHLYEISKLAFDASVDLPLFDSLRSRHEKQKRVEVSSDAKVSVIMPVYNAEDRIQAALDSMLSQTWTNLEVLVVDDCSTDATVSIVEGYLSRDPRVQLIRAKTNGGAYVARNLALRVATGAFVTCHDADDWSHPEKIEKQVRHLLCNPLVVGNTSQQARATPDLRFYRKEKPGKYISPNYSSFMFRREPVTGAVGYWDSVRFAADEEFRERVEKVFGDQSVVDEPTGPLSFVRSFSSALTRCEALGFHGAVAGARKEYRESYKHFHYRAKNLYYDFPQDSRPFAVPEPMQPTRESKAAQRRHFDVILVSDFRLPGGTTSSNVEELQAQKRVGLRTGLIQMSRYGFDPDRPTDPRVRELLDGHQVQMLVYGEKVSCDTLILKHPPILQEWQQFVPDVEAANVHVVMNQTPMNHYGDEGKLEYSISRCKDHLQRCFGKAGVWHPIGPLVREALYRHHAEELTEITLANEDWTDIIDVAEWRRESRPQRGPRPRIGRHSRDEDRKWPKDPSELLAVYPGSDEYEVHVLGGAEAPKKVLGSLPKNWHVLGFGEVHPKDFLSTLDVFVYYTHPELVEAFGRTILEAMAVGVPVILPYGFRELFKEAAIYAEPAEVKGRIDRLMMDDDHYESQVKIAWDYVEEHFGYIKHTVRLRKQIGKDIGSVDLTR